MPGIVLAPCVYVCVLQNFPSRACNLDEEVRGGLENEAYYKRNTCIKHLPSSGALQVSRVILSTLRGGGIMVTSQLADVPVKAQYMAQGHPSSWVELEIKPRLSFLNPC